MVVVVVGVVLVGPQVEAAAGALQREVVVDPLHPLAGVASKGTPLRSWALLPTCTWTSLL